MLYQHNPTGLRLSRSVVAGLALALFPMGFQTLQAQPTATVSISPANPTTDDHVVAHLSGNWPDSCAPGAVLAPHLSSGAHQFSVQFVAGNGDCATVITPWSLDVPLGVLAAGSYTLSSAFLPPFQPALVLGALTFTVTPPQKSTVYTAAFLAQREVTLSSRLTAYNNGGNTAILEPVASYDADGAHSLADLSPITLAPGEAAAIETGALRAGNSLQIVALLTPTHVALRPVLERSVLVEGRAVSQGRLPLPLFRELVAAGATAVSGDVRLFESTASGCGDPRARIRRANLTLFNAGNSPADFTVELVEPSASGTRTIATMHYEVSAETTRQFNSFISPGDLCAAGSSGNVWFRITTGQPSLAYVSTTIDDPEVGSIPYEVYPANIQN
jgi:hypothetical protein